MADRNDFLVYYLPRHIIVRPMTNPARDLLDCMGYGAQEAIELTKQHAHYLIGSILVNKLTIGEIDRLGQ